MHLGQISVCVRAAEREGGGDSPNRPRPWLRRDQVVSNKGYRKELNCCAVLCCDELRPEHGGPSWVNLLRLASCDLTEGEHLVRRQVATRRCGYRVGAGVGVSGSVREKRCGRMHKRRVFGQAARRSRYIRGCYAGLKPKGSECLWAERIGREGRRRQQRKRAECCPCWCLSSRGPGRVLLWPL